MFPTFVLEAEYQTWEVSGAAGRLFFSLHGRCDPASLADVSWIQGPDHLLQDLSITPNSNSALMW